jgi:monoamine oxidase
VNVVADPDMTCTAPMRSQPSVIIMGGGLSGLCLAQALVRNGFETKAFERDSGPGVRCQGYRLTIDAIGSEALRSCLPPSTVSIPSRYSGQSL